MLFFITILLLGIFLYGFIYLFGKMNDHNTKSQLAETEWKKEALRRDKIKTLNNSVQIIEAQKAQIETHFAESSDVVPFLDTVERLAKEAGNKAEVISVNISDDKNGLLVGIQASGSFANLYKFLTLLENSPYELEFMGVDMHQGIGRDWKATFKIKLLSFVI